MWPSAIQTSPPNPEDPAANPAPDAVFAARALQEQLQDALHGLPPQQRAVLLLRRFGELSTAEVADTLGLSLKTVENHLGRALQRLRQVIK
jgi:RNA polymerase sigma factor (sigma-70 family)